MAWLWDQGMEAGGRQAKPSLQKPLATANSACTFLAPFSTPCGSCAWEAGAASSAPLGGAELSSNYRQPAPGQPQFPLFPVRHRAVG